MHIQIYDTTLRDGTQREGISLSCEDKVKIALKLDELGVEFIEGGWPGSNPKDAEFFRRAVDLKLKNATVTAFGATCRVDSDPADDPNINALLDSHTSVCAVVGKTSLRHVKEVLQTPPAENLRIIEQSIAYLVSQGRRVIYDAEHFFDGYKLDKTYALETLRAAVREGCVQVQGTINGYGERCGNANLVSIMADLELKMGHKCVPNGNIKLLTDVSHFVAEVANLAPDEHLAYAGKSAFAHKGGIHVAAIRRTVDSYQHIDPALVGNKMRIVMSEL